MVGLGQDDPATEEVGKMPTLFEYTGEPPMPLFEEAAASHFPIINLSEIFFWSWRRESAN